MYENAAVLAVCVLVYSAVAGRVERSWLSGPIVFTVAGFILGPAVLGLLHLSVTATAVRLLAEATLAMVLFCDAAKTDLSVLRRSLLLPKRLLLFGLPLTIVLGALVAALIFPTLGALEWALMATMLAPTDAALGKPVVTNPAVPGVFREALNLESGLNDGICVPIIVILLGLAVGTQLEVRPVSHAATVVAEEIGIGLLVGLILSGAAMLILRRAARHGWMAAEWAELPAVALAVGCFTTAQALGGSGFIACFTGGFFVARTGLERKDELLSGAEATGEGLALITWVLFGAVAIAPCLNRLNWPVLLYSVLSLTLIRMLPVYLCLVGTGVGTLGRLFIGWFGPRGLASIVFGIIILDEKLPGNDTLMEVVICTVLLSVLAHGISANPIVTALRTRLAASAG